MDVIGLSDGLKSPPASGAESDNCDKKDSNISSIFSKAGGILIKGNVVKYCEEVRGGCGRMRSYCEASVLMSEYGFESIVKLGGLALVLG